MYEVENFNLRINGVFYSKISEGHTWTNYIKNPTTTIIENITNDEDFCFTLRKSIWDGNGVSMWTHECELVSIEPTYNIDTRHYRRCMYHKHV